MKINHLFLVGTILSLGVASSRADLLEGSLGLNGLSPEQNGANLGVSTEISANPVTTGSAGAGEYNPIPLLTSFGSVTIDLTTIATGGGVSIANATYGSFSATVGQIVQQGANFLDVYVEGLFTPAAGLPGGDEPTPTSLRFSINQSGESLSMAITLASPPRPPAVPEVASTMVLALLGLAGVGSMRAFRKS